MIEFTINLAPQPKARPRVAVVKGHALVYTPKKTRVFEAEVAAIAQQHFPQPLKGPVILNILFLLPRPKTLMRRKDPEDEIPHITRPDLDNLTKSITDGLNGVAYIDDRQIWRLNTSKLYHSKTGHPQIRIKIWGIEEEESRL